MVETRVERVEAAAPEVASLVDELEAELSRHYPAHQRHGLALNAIFQPGISFFIARHGDQAAGCGGIARCDGFAEVKRMYVRPSFRGTGVADAIMEQLMAEAVAAGLGLLRLETGTRQEAAMRFYARWGFGPCEAFEPYRSIPHEKIATSVFLEKRLS